MPLGDLTSAQMRVIGDLPRAYGDGTVRVTIGSGSGVPLGEVRRRARSCTRAWPPRAWGSRRPATIADVASCPGAESCRLAVTQSRGLGRLLEDHLRARPDLIAAADGARIKISGCPNGCGQHHIATIGFQGSVRRIGGRAVPQYFVMVGGGHASTAAPRSAAWPRRFPHGAFRTSSTGSSRCTARRTQGESRRRRSSAASSVERVRLTLADLERMTVADAAPDDYVDLAESAEFAPEVMDGECSA